MRSKHVQTEPGKNEVVGGDVPGRENYLPYVLQYLMKIFEKEVLEIYSGNQAAETKMLEQRAGEIISFAKVYNEQSVVVDHKVVSTLAICSRYLMHKFNEKGRVVSETIRFFKVIRSFLTLLRDYRNITPKSRYLPLS